MARGGRPSRLPKEVAARLKHAGRPLAYASTADGWVVGTRDALVIGDRVLPWEQVEDADWNADDSRLTVREVGRYGEPRASYELVLDEPGRLLELVRERVTASVVLQRRVNIERKRGFLVIARRPPSGGEISWMVEYDATVDPADPSVEIFVQDALASARAEVGM